jgi:hypothetical protein
MKFSSMAILRISLSFWLFYRCVAFQSTTPVPKISLSEFQPEAYQDKPLVIETGMDVESLCDGLMEHISSKTITLQQKQKQQTKFYECTVHQAIDPIMLKSKHGNSFFAFSEGLLDDYEYSKHLTGKELLLNSDDANEVDCWFDYFPPHLQPSDCVILAGEGATSTLHRDPFEWTGTSLCLEGTKLWRFLDPKDSVSDIDELLKAYRLPSTAWNSENNDDIPLSAGWQSDFSLYADRYKFIPSAKSLSNMNDDQRFDKLDSIAMDWQQLRPNNKDLIQSVCWTVIQKPGDLLLIPAHWWHQTYGLEPSLAVASQRCVSKIDAGRVIQHMLSTTGALDTAPDILIQEDYASYKEKEKVAQIMNSLFGHLEESL